MRQTSPHSISQQQALPLRPTELVMDLDRLGSSYPTRLSFMRVLMRKLRKERWTIERVLFTLDDQGHGTCVYQIQAKHELFSLVIFCHEPDGQTRSDRVIAESWDMTMTLVHGSVDQAHLAELERNVPYQEKGRVDARSLVLSRANKSSRNFSYVVDCLADGKQPNAKKLARVGYLYRTTAVYGSGKFGMSDWQKVKQHHLDFAQPFAAEMFTCWMIRHFSFEQAEHIARARAPGKAVKLQPALKRYLGIGNATGLGMAPFLIRHPLLIARWIECREVALARVLAQTSLPSSQTWSSLLALMERAAHHLMDIETSSSEQNKLNDQTAQELSRLRGHLASSPPMAWRDLAKLSAKEYSVETQELLNSLFIELHPELVDDLADATATNECYAVRAEQTLAEFADMLKRRYAWALEIDFNQAHNRATFWYYSEEKLEPRLGKHGVDDGADKAMKLIVAADVRHCFDLVQAHLSAAPDDLVAHFLLQHDDQRRIVARTQTMAQTPFGDIQANLAADDVIPLKLLRCKLAFFGVGRFAPKSILWVRNTMFQGAPLVEDCADAECTLDDDWSFVLTP